MDISTIVGGAAGTGLLAWLLIAQRQHIGQGLGWVVNRVRTMLRGMWQLLLIAADADNVEALGHILEHAADLKEHLARNEALIRDETDANRRRIADNYKTLDRRVDEELKEVYSRLATLEGATAEHGKSIQSLILRGD